jgi:hypothetical protein
MDDVSDLKRYLRIAISTLRGIRIKRDVMDDVSDLKRYLRIAISTLRGIRIKRDVMDDVSDFRRSFITTIRHTSLASL